MNREIINCNLNKCVICGTVPVCEKFLPDCSFSSGSVRILCDCGNKVEMDPHKTGIKTITGESGWDWSERALVEAVNICISRWNILNPEEHKSCSLFEEHNKKLIELTSKYDKNKKINTISGLTAGEEEAMDRLMECYASFLKLERTHPSELSDFVYAVHLIQGLLCKRVIRRKYPQFWITDNGEIEK